MRHERSAADKKLQAKIEELSTMIRAYALCIKDMGNSEQLERTRASTLKCLEELQEVYDLPYKYKFPYDPSAEDDEDIREDWEKNWNASES